MGLALPVALRSWHARCREEGALGVSLFCNGKPADAADLAAAALVNYGHFTSMQVRGGAVQGLHLHLRRLQAGTRTLFDAALDEERLRHDLRTALAASGAADASVRITVFSREFDFRDPLRAVMPDVLISLSPPSDAGPAPVRVQPVRFVRELPHIKHVGTFALFHLRRQAMTAGFDDALLVDAEGALVEGSVWNLGLWDGASVTWPQGPSLSGTRQALLAEGLDALGIRQCTRRVALDEVSQFDAAFACNARGQWPLAEIAGLDWRGGALPEDVGRALQTQPWQAI